MYDTQTDAERRAVERARDRDAALDFRLEAAKVMKQKILAILDRYIIGYEPLVKENNSYAENCLYTTRAIRNTIASLEEKVVISL